MEPSQDRRFILFLSGGAARSHRTEKKVTVASKPVNTRGAVERQSRPAPLFQGQRDENFEATPGAKNCREHLQQNACLLGADL
jgi:hypothetical protein